MFGWSFAVRTIDELEMLLRALGGHRYLLEADLRLHWTIDLALSAIDPSFAPAALEFAQLRGSRDDLDLASADLALWRSATVEEVVAALGCFWTPGPRGAEARAGLAAVLREAGIAVPGHEPFRCDPDAPPVPELVLLDWTLLPPSELDRELHAGALRALAARPDEVGDPDAPVFLEGPILAEPELVAGAPRGVLPMDPLFWADGPYPYCEYVLSGVARAAGLVDPPVGFRDIDKL